jgi:hypothetical protein
MASRRAVSSSTSALPAMAAVMSAAMAVLFKARGRLSLAVWSRAIRLLDPVLPLDLTQRRLLARPWRQLDAALNDFVNANSWQPDNLISL